jgi:murein DD-endopeptidase MepM/ murein hydrolase activator NlpD
MVRAWWCESRWGVMKRFAIVRFVVLLLFVTAVGFAAQTLPADDNSRAAESATASADDGPGAAESATAPADDSAGASAGATTEEASAPRSMTLHQGTVNRGQSAYKLLRRAGVSAKEVLTLQRATRSVYDIRRLRVGQPYRIEVTAEGLLQRFGYEVDAEHRLEVVRQDQTFVGQLQPIVYERKQRVVQGTVYGSLYETLASQEETPRIAADLADVFAWEVDFHTDVRDGDTFRVLIEERYRDGALVGYHRIVAAELVSRQQVFQAVYFPPEKDGGAYYHPDGRSMRRMFLRSPLRYTRISSRFSHRRFHPVLKRYRPHLGIDYAAPIGTPVRSVADGVVVRAGRRGANGKMVQIRHNSVYSTYYLHLSRFARGVRRGTRVAQGQLIGYVGSTGLSTGPHLDFRITKHGKYLNPLRNKNIAAPPLPQRALPAFQVYAERLLAKLTNAEPTHQQVAVHP